MRYARGQTDKQTQAYRHADCNTLHGYRGRSRTLPTLTSCSSYTFAIDLHLVQKLCKYFIFIMNSYHFHRQTVPVCDERVRPRNYVCHMFAFPPASSATRLSAFYRLGDRQNRVVHARQRIASDDDEKCMRHSTHRSTSEASRGAAHPAHDIGGNGVSSTQK